MYVYRIDLPRGVEIQGSTSPQVRERIVVNAAQIWVCPFCFGKDPEKKFYKNECVMELLKPCDHAS